MEKREAIKEIRKIKYHAPNTITILSPFLLPSAQTKSLPHPLVVFPLVPLGKRRVRAHFLPASGALGGGAAAVLLDVRGDAAGAVRARQRRLL